jgi:c(7)-type cytochrome triheme protein
MREVEEDLTMASGSSLLGSLLHKSARILAAALLAAAGALVGSLASRHGPEPELRLPPDRVLDEQDSPAAVVFSHTNHVAYTDSRCLACHPQPFSILGRHRPVLHEEMDAGGTCGICHNGSDATDVDVEESCNVCHTGAEPRDVRLARSADSLGQVIFHHATHHQSCRTCHPKPFAMQAGTTPLVKDEMFEGGTCGRCHDGDEAFGVDDGDHCEKCHMAGRGGP